MRAELPKVWTRNQKINFYLNWFLVAVMYLMLLMPAINGVKPDTKSLGTALLVNAWVYGYLWKMSGKNKWIGALIGAVSYFIVGVIALVIYAKTVA